MVSDRKMNRKVIVTSRLAQSYFPGFKQKTILKLDMHPGCVNGRSILTFVVLSYFCIFAQGTGDSIIGQWYTEGCQAIFDFYRVGEEYQAKLYPLDSLEVLDVHNPVDSLKTRSIRGLTTLSGLTYNPKKKRWVNGKIYNPEDGRTYSCYCSFRKGGTRLYFRGYIGVSILGGSQTWTREKCPEGK